MESGLTVTPRVHLKFLDGNARLLQGKAVAEGMIKLPVVNYFEVRVKANDVSSEGL